MVKGYAGEIESKAEVIAKSEAGAGVGYITDAMDAVEIAEVLRPEVARRILGRLRDDEVSSGELVKLLSMLSDRIDGKVTEKIEHSGTVGLAAILAEVSGKTAGLPDPAWFAIDNEAVGSYDKGAGVIALEAEVVDGGYVLESEKDKIL